MISEEGDLHDPIDPERQSGRTWRQMAELPDGSIYLVPSGKIAAYCERLLFKMGRSRNSIQFATPDNFNRFLGAIAPAVGVDHAYWEVTGASSRAKEAHDFVHLCVIPGR